MPVNLTRAGASTGRSGNSEGVIQAGRSCNGDVIAAGSVLPVDRSGRNDVTAGGVIPMVRSGNGDVIQAGRSSDVITAGRTGRNGVRAGGAGRWGQGDGGVVGGTVRTRAALRRLYNKVVGQVIETKEGNTMSSLQINLSSSI